MRTFFLLVALLMATNASQAADLDIKGLKPGMSLEQIKALFPNIVCAEEADTGCGLFDTSYAGVNSQIIISLLGEKVMLITVSFDSESFDVVISAIKEKFGPPATIVKDEVQNMMGARFMNQLYLWKKGDKHLIAERYHSKIGESSITLSSGSSLNQIDKGLKKGVKEKAKDL